MSDDRTQSPSRIRRDAARAAGRAPHSALLTTAAALIVAVLAVSQFGGPLLSVAVDAVRNSISTSGAEPIATVSESVTAWRTLGGAFALTLAGVGALVVVASIVAHQLQVGGVWAPARLAPSWGRLWNLGGGDDDEGALGRSLFAGAGRGLFAILRSIAVIGAAVAVLCVHSHTLMELPASDFAACIATTGRVLTQAVLAIGIVLAIMGVADFALKLRQFENMLRTTPEEHRAEQRAIDGDPAVRSRRAQIARSWMRDPGEVLAGTSIALTGHAGLTVLLAGSPPPGRLTVRTIARGVAASSLRHAAESGGIPVIRAAELAAWFASREARSAPLPERLVAELRHIWGPRTTPVSRSA